MWGHLLVRAPLSQALPVSGRAGQVPEVPRTPAQGGYGQTSTRRRVASRGVAPSPGPSQGARRPAPSVPGHLLTQNLEPHRASMGPRRGGQEGECGSLPGQAGATAPGAASAPSPPQRCAPPPPPATTPRAPPPPPSAPPAAPGPAYGSLGGISSLGELRQSFPRLRLAGRDSGSGDWRAIDTVTTPSSGQWAAPERYPSRY